MMIFWSTVDILSKMPTLFTKESWTLQEKMFRSFAYVRQFNVFFLNELPPSFLPKRRIFPSLSQPRLPLPSPPAGHPLHRLRLQEGQDLAAAHQALQAPVPGDAGRGRLPLHGLQWRGCHVLHGPHPPEQGPRPPRSMQYSPHCGPTARPSPLGSPTFNLLQSS